MWNMDSLFPSWKIQQQTSKKKKNNEKRIARDTRAICKSGLSNVN